MPISPKPPSSPRFSTASLLEIPSSSSSHSSSSHAHPSQQHYQIQRSSSGSLLRSPSPSHQSLLPSSSSSRSSSPSPSSFLDSLMPNRPPAGRSVSPGSQLGLSVGGGPSSPIGQTFQKVALAGATLKAKLARTVSAASRPRKQSLLGEDNKDDNGVLPSMQQRVGGRKGWRTSAMESLWWLIFWSAVVIYLRALGGFGAQEAALWEDKKITN
ncbi:hypothetical protein BDY24DRAFT_415986 [Mrakia frigida]|uniref:uncharacterized protein n=1 Tax=Mrakia frigida TaxID=29902 RepID=UPI003FCC083F